MFKSIKVKIISTVMLLFIVSIAILTTISSSQVKHKTEESLIEQSILFTDEMNQSISYFFEQFEKGLLQLSTSNAITDFVVESSTITPELAQQSMTNTEDAFTEFMDLYNDADSVYYALETKHSVSIPVADLAEDFDDTQRPWYKQSVANPDKVQWTSPYLDHESGEYVITLSKAILHNNEVQGVLGLDIRLDALTNKIAEKEIGYKGYPIILDQDGIAIVHPTLRGESMADHDFFNDMNESDHGTIYYSDEGHDKISVFTTSPGLNWKIGVIYDQQEMSSTAKDLSKFMIIFAGITLLVFFSILYIMISRQMKPIGILNHLMDAVSNGDLTVRSTINSNDEIGALSNNFNKMIENTNNIISVVNSSALNVRASSESLSAVSEETSASSEEVAHAVNEIAHGASKSAEDAEVVTERSDLLGTQINEITAKAGMMSDIATKAGIMNYRRTSTNE